MKITKATVERAKAPVIGQRFIRDDEIEGFALRVTANGARSFIWEGRIKGRMRRLTLGRYPDLSVLLARNQALEVRGRIARGENPADERQVERGEPTFGELADRYIEQHSKPHKDSWERDATRIEKHFARWRTRRLSDIPRDEVIRVQHAIAEQHGKVASNRAMTLLRSIFNKAADWGMFDGANPAVKLTLFREEKRERFLSPDELRRVNEALAQESNIYWRAYFALALMLGTRRNELLSARWTDLDLEQRTLRIPETKADRSHLLPLPEPTIDILRSLPSRPAAGFVFPGEGATGHLVEVKSAWQRIRQRAGVPDVTVHDLRRTLGSWLAAAGYNLPLIGRVLNHKDLASTQIYSRMALDPVREALERNAILMMANGTLTDSQRHSENR